MRLRCKGCRGTPHASTQVCTHPPNHPPTHTYLNNSLHPQYSIVKDSSADIVVIGGDNLPSPVGIGLTDLPIMGGGGSITISDKK